MLGRGFGEQFMKLLANATAPKRFRWWIATSTVVACFAVWPLRLFAQSQVATELEEVQKLKEAELQDYQNAMSFENSNQKLGNYYLHKGADVHKLIDEMEAGKQANPADINKALDTSDAENYDNRRPVPLEDEIGNGY
jgi:hypothetical protein